MCGPCVGVSSTTLSAPLPILSARGPCDCLGEDDCLFLDGESSYDLADKGTLLFSTLSLKPATSPLDLSELKSSGLTCSVLLSVSGLYGCLGDGL